jgi:amino acid transporter/nucleotide-binding universal stress UspA family protein
MDGIGVHRPRNLDWKRAAALLYGDWGTSKAYVIGLAFVAAGYAALPIIAAVCFLTLVVGYNYSIVCEHFPDGGGVYSAAREQSRVLAVMGALLLVANFAVTAALSGWAAMSYFGLTSDTVRWATMGIILLIGLVNHFGPKHTGNFAAALAVPMVAVVLLIIIASVPYLTTGYLERSTHAFGKNWVAFVGIILALSGVEAIANLTGVMKLDRSSTMEQPRVGSTARKAIWPVALEVVIGTTLLGWAMLSVPKELTETLERRWEDMVRFLAEHYSSLALTDYLHLEPNLAQHVGSIFGFVVGIVIGLLLLSAVNTAIGAMIGLMYMLSRDGEMPRSFTRLNAHGVPRVPLILATLLPFAVTAVATNLESLAGLYSIGVVGAITVNLGVCTFNKRLPLRWFDRCIMGVTFAVLFAVEFTIAKTKNDALLFAVCVLGAGFALRAYSQKRAGLRTLTVRQELAAHVAPELSPDFRLNLGGGQSILVAARGFTPVLRFALEEARLRQANLYVLYAKELAVTLPGPLEQTERLRWQDDPEAARIMCSMLELGRQHQVTVVPLYAVSDNPAATILDLSATLGIDILMLGARHRRTLAQLFKGDVANQVARDLPENIQLVIYG